MEENDDLKQQLNRALVAVEEARSARRELWSRYNALSAANRSLHLELEGIKAARDKALLARDESRSQLQKALTERDDARRERDQVQTTLETDRESASTETAMMREELASECSLYISRFDQKSGHGTLGQNASLTTPCE